MASNPHLMDEKDIPSDWKPVDASVPTGAPAPPVPHDMPQYFSGSLPPVMQHDVNFVATKMGSPRIPKSSLMPFGNQLNPFTNAAAQSTAKIVVTQAISAIPVVPSATSVTDGLIHGDKIWETDSAYASIRDEFTGGNSLSGSIGDVGWTIFNSAGGTALPMKGVGSLPAVGAWGISNSGTANGYQNINLAPLVVGGSDFFMPLFDYPVGWKATFVFGFSLGFQDAVTGPFFTKKSIYVGLAATFDPPTAWSARPNIFYGLRYDTDTTAPSIADTTMKFEVVNNLENLTTSGTRKNTQGTVVDTGVTPAMGVLYRLEIQMVAAGVITMSLNGSAPTSFTIPTIVAGGAGANGQASINANIGRLKVGPTAAQFDHSIFVGGSKVVVAGVTSFWAALNGSRTLISTTVGPSSKFPLITGNVGNGSVTDTTMTGFPGVVPIFSFGNDTQATPTANSLSFLVDYFSLVWNPGVGGGTGTPSSTLPRYF